MKELHDRVAAEVGRVVVGQEEALEDLLAGLDRAGRRCGVPLEVLHQLHGGHEPLLVRTGVLPAGQPGHPPRGEQLQGVPACGAPALGDPAAVQDDVVASGPGEQVAHGQAGVPGADDDGVDGGHRVPFGCSVPVGGVGRPAMPHTFTGRPSFALPSAGRPAVRTEDAEKVGPGTSCHRAIR